MIKEFIIGVMLTTGHGFPVAGELSSKFGPRVSPTGPHKGIDIKAETGTPIFSPAEGIVEFVGAQNGYGNLIIIRHQRTLTTKYGHLSSIFVYEGETVRRGDVIGTVGDTGRSTGPHLHYEIRRSNIPIDPLKYIFTIVLKERK